MASLLSMAPFGQCNLFLNHDAPGLYLKMLNVVRLRSLTHPASIVATVRWLSFYSIKFTLVGFPQLRNKKNGALQLDQIFPWKSVSTFSLLLLWSRFIQNSIKRTNYIRLTVNLWPIAHFPMKSFGWFHNWYVSLFLSCVIHGIKLLQLTLISHLSYCYFELYGYRNIS